MENKLPYWGKCCLQLLEERLCFSFLILWYIIEALGFAANLLTGYLLLVSYSFQKINGVIA